MLELGVWLSHQLDSASSQNGVLSVRIRAPIDARALQDAWRWVTARHPMMRATFHSGDEGPHRIVQETLEPDFRLIELDGGEEELRARAIEEARRPFDLSKHNRCLCMIRREPNDAVLMFVNHHIADDFTSAELIFD